MPYFAEKYYEIWHTSIITIITMRSQTLRP